MRLAPLLAGVVLAAAGSRLSAQDLVILHTNDVHGYAFPRAFAGEQLDPSDLGVRIGGLFSTSTLKRWIETGDRRLASKKLESPLLNSLAGKKTPVLFLDAGDWYGGTLFGEVTRGQAMAQVLSDPDLGVDATVFGNHAWDFGATAAHEFVAALEKAKKPALLGANLRYQGAPRGLPSMIFERAGKKIGVVGLCTDGALRASLPEKTKGWVVEDELETLEGILPDLRSQSDLVVLLSHIGYGRDDEKRKELDRFDDGHPERNLELVIDGHSHRDEEVWADADTFVVQADHYGLKAGVVAVRFDTGGKPSFQAERVLLRSDRIPEDRRMKRRWKKLLRDRVRTESKTVVTVAPGVQVPHLLRTDQEHLRSPIGDLVAEAMFRAAKDAGARPDFTMVYQKGVRSGLYALGDGNFSAGDLHAVSPFGGPLFVVEAPGKTFWRTIQGSIQTKRRVSYARASLKAREKGGKRELVSFQVGGESFDPKKTYRVVVDEFMAGWFRGKGVTKTKVGSSPKMALENLLLSAAKGGILRQADVDALAPPSARLER